MIHAPLSSARPARYRAILLDLDGTLLDEAGRVHPENARALRDLEARGGRVMIATGRSTASTIPIVDEIGLQTPAVTFNGAGLWCPVQRRMLEERVLSARTVARALEFAEREDLLTVVMTNDAKYASPPRDELERSSLQGLVGLAVRSRDELSRVEFVVRVTLFSRGHATSAVLHDEAQAWLRHPVYLTHFPLSALPTHRANPLSVLDVHPPCRGKGEGVRALGEAYGIAAAETVAVGDATNDLPMFAAAGLSVAMATGMPEAIAAAHRLLPHNEGTAIAELVAELFPA
ncbi:MAG: HAD family phosphatase [Planctomycetes bacterium]|nr:HAD family phosphatase [Planctomycetota bacterium]